MESHAQLIQQITEKNLAGQIHNFSRLLAHLSERRWASDGYPELRSGHVQLLRHLDSAGTRAVVLAQRAGVTKQTMGRLVRELAGVGYLSLTPDAADSRAQLVRLSARGEAFLVYLAATLNELEQAFERVIGTTSLHDFTASLRELTAFAQARQRGEA